MHQLTIIWVFIINSIVVLAQISKGSFALVTTDPICVQCDYATVMWSGGTSPYRLSVSGQRNSYKIANVGITATNQMKWHVNFPTGTKLWFQLIDSNNTDIYTNIVAVTGSPDASCVNVTNPLVTDSSTTLSSLPTRSDGLTSTAETSSAGSSPNSGSNSNSNTSSSRTSVGPIVGGVVAGIVVLLLSLVLVIWVCRRTKRQGSVSSLQNKLDLVDDRDGMVVEPFVPTAEMSQTSQHASTKIGAATLSATQIISSDAGPSNSASSSSVGQSLHEVPLSVSRPSTASRKYTRQHETHPDPVQESDAGVCLMGDSHREEPSTLPPAYDSSWRD